MKLIGRGLEQKQLQDMLESKEAELMAIYGRRRVGKTFLIRSFFEKKKVLFFQNSGIHKGPLSAQLSVFKSSMEVAFYPNKKGPSIPVPQNWMEAFAMLTDAIELEVKTSSKKIVIFLDEFPWMATHKSGLLEAFDYHWNRFWVNYPRIKFIICGSAASWIIDKILNDRGGLHNRVTRRIRLSSFSLYETKLFLREKGLKWNNHQILDLYMAIGGIPFYLKFVESGLSAIQNIDKLCFQHGGILRDEFQSLFTSLFENSEVHTDIIKIIAGSYAGVTRSEIEQKTKIDGGRLSIKLNELIESGFISPFIPFGKARGLYYRIIDEYSIFYLKWIKGLEKTAAIAPGYWESIAPLPEGRTWAGYAFESVCYKHLHNIRKALHIPNGSIATSFQYKTQLAKTILNLQESDTGTQIDLLFDRPDGIVNICEIKYCNKPYTIDKAYAKVLLQKVSTYLKVSKSVKQSYISMITSDKLKQNLYSKELVSSEVTLDDFFMN